MKKISLYWALLIGLLSLAAQIITFYVRFGRWNMISGVLDYVLFFIAGALGGWILIYFLNKQASTARRWDGADRLPAGFTGCVDHDARRRIARLDRYITLPSNSLGAFHMDWLVGGEVGEVRMK